MDTKNETALFEFDVDSEGMAWMHCRMHYLRLDRRLVCFLYIRRQFVARINVREKDTVGAVSMGDAIGEALAFLRLHPEHFRPFEPKGAQGKRGRRKGSNNV
jgi:hypothetical protein